MKFHVLIMGLTAALTVNAQNYPDCPSCLKMNNICYNISHVLDFSAEFRKQVVIPKMAILRSKNTLFYSFEPIFEDLEYYKTGFVNLDNPDEQGVITGRQILNLGTFDIDQKNNIVYFGGSDGIFVLDFNVNTMSAYSSRGDTITNIFYKDKVYFTKYNENGIIVKNGDMFRVLHEDLQVKTFVVTKDNVFVYINGTGLHVSKGGLAHTLSIYPFFRGITMDLEGNVYTWWLDGIYKIDINKILQLTKMYRVAELADIGTIAFDNENNILFNVDRSLYVMKKTSSGCEIVGEE